MSLTKVVWLGTIWYPDSSCENVVKVASRDLKKLPADIKAIEEVVRELLRGRVEGEERARVGGQSL